MNIIRLMRTRLAIFASGSGSNAENIISYFRDSQEVSISLILTNNPSAGVIERADRLGIECCVFSKEEFYSSKRIQNLLKEREVDFVVLAGFLLLVPPSLIQTYKGKIINIHPALLPAFGGKGFYGDRVHAAVLESGQSMSGISIHHVTEKFDEGGIIFQAACHVDRKDSIKSLALKIHALEYKFFPVVLEKMISVQNAPYE